LHLFSAVALACCRCICSVICICIALAVAFAFLVVIPEGDLLLPFAFRLKKPNLDSPQISPQKHMSSPKLTKTLANQGD
jgi:hypothetical protein